MKTLALKHILKHILPLIILIFLLVAFLGAGHIGMTVDARGQMVACPFLGVSALCEMNSLAHIAKWQSLFSALPEREAAAFLAVVLLSLSTIFLLWHVRYAHSVSTLPFLVLASRAVTVLIPSILQEAFSDGILNPKVF